LGNEVKEDKMDSVCVLHGGKRNTYSFLEGKSKERDSFEDLVVDGRKILNGF
jgi:hypothetical protein